MRGFIFGVIVGAVLVGTVNLVQHANAASVSPQAITGPSTTASCNINPFEIDFLNDGSFVVDLAVTLNSATRVRHNGISADGTTFTLDGVAVASPPAALQQLGSALSAASPKITAAYSVASVQTALCGP